MAPFKSSLAKSASKLFGVFNQSDLSLRGAAAKTKFVDPNTDWIRILNQAGPSSGTLSFDNVGYNELLIFGVGGGAGGAAGSDDDGGGGGAGAAGQVNGYRIQSINPAHTYTYSIPGGGAAVISTGDDGNPGGDTTLSDPGGVIFSLTGGAGAAQGPSNSNAYAAPATANPPYGSHGGGGGSINEGRYVDRRSTSGVPGNYGGAGGGGGGTWTRNDEQGTAGLNNTMPSTTVSSYAGRDLDVAFSCVGTNGTAASPPTNFGGSPGPGAANNNDPAGGAAGRPYTGGGGAGGGLRFFGTGNGGYGAGGGAAGGQQASAPSGAGGAGYLVVYARVSV